MDQDRYTARMAAHLQTDVSAGPNGDGPRFNDAGHRTTPSAAEVTFDCSDILSDPGAPARRPVLLGESHSGVARSAILPKATIDDVLDKGGRELCPPAPGESKLVRHFAPVGERFGDE